MRAVVIKDAYCARNWQSQRVTRRSAGALSRTPEPAETVFQPIPPHNGQTSGGALITEHPESELRFLNLTVPHEGAFAQVPRRVLLCTSCAAGLPSVED